MNARMLLLALLPAGVACAQSTVAPTPERAGPSRGEDVDGYNVVSSFETGYRFLSAGGDLGKYRSDVNFGNGLRLLGSFLSVHSKEGQGGLFDEIVLTTQGLGNDPYEFSSLRIQKNKLYRYNLAWRLNEYSNPALTIANGQHFMNTTRRLQDHDFTLLPQSPFKLFLGYSRNSQDGPALTTIQQFNSLGDVFPLFANVRRLRNEYRLGGEARLGALRLNVLRGWDDFKEDTPIALPRPSAGNDPSDATTLSSLGRTEPYHGTTPYWRVNLFSESGPWFAVNGRFTHAMGRRNSLFDETSAGTDSFGAARNRQLLVFGDGRRPVTTGDLTLSFLPAGRLTVGNHTAFHDTRMEGDSSYQEVNNTTLSDTLLFFRYLGIRTLINTTDATLRATKWLGFYGGYQYSTRRIRTVSQFGIRNVVTRGQTEQENRIHAGLAGIRLQPVKPLTIRLDAEIGRADHPFYPIAEKNYQALGARAHYRTRTVQLSAAARSSYNLNSVTLTSHSMKSRVYSFDASWTPRDWFGLDAGYAKRHLDTVSGIAYFATGELIQGDRSIYISNLHTGNFGARIEIRRRASLYFGYSHAQDLGDGRDTPIAGATGSQLPVFLAAQTFPVAFRSPQARLSIRLHERLRWNFGYQYYGYREQFFAEHGYRAHTGYTSVLWSF